MEPFAQILIVLLSLFAFDVLALNQGADSRETFADDHRR
jgi:hypothetical protein